MSIPSAEVAGIIRLSLVIMTILLFSPNAFGIDGPVISASRIAVCFPLLFIFTAIMAVTRDFPTPPLPLTTPITFFTLLAGFNGSKKLVCSAVRLLQDSATGTAVMGTIFAHVNSSSSIHFVHVSIPHFSGKQNPCIQKYPVSCSLYDVPSKIYLVRASKSVII